MRVLIFSDLHLTHSTDALYGSLIQVLNQVLVDSQTEVFQIVFAGDIFDLLVGSSSFYYHQYAQFFSAVEELHQAKVRLYYIEGNHDFHLKRLFKTQTVQFVEASVTISVDECQKKLWIEHGDLVDQEDHGYLRLRRFLRSSFMRWVIHHVPGRWIQFIGASFSRSLSQKEAELPHHWPENKRMNLRRLFRAYAETKKRQGFDYVILGHCHDLDESPPFYWNMGYPPVHRQYLCYDSKEDFVKRVNFPGI